MTDHSLAEVIEPSVLKARRAARAARDLADTLADARREAIDAERSALAALRQAAAKSVARTARLEKLEADLTAARAEREALEARLASERHIREALEDRLTAEAAERSALLDQLAEARAAGEALAAELAGTRSERDRLAAALSAAPSPPDRVPPPDSLAPSTDDHTPEPARPAPASLKALAAAQVEAAAAARRSQDARAAGRASPEAARVAAELDRAAAALRSRAAGSGTLEVPEALQAGTVEAFAPPAPRPAVRTALRPASPSLRAALVRFAHGNPAAAGILLAGLLPAQGAVVGADLDYDLTIRGTGTYAVTLAAGTARVRSIAAFRGRSETQLQITADPLALAELLLGSRRRIGRLHRDLRFRGRRRALDLLEPLVRSELSLADAIRAGARIDPVAALLALAVAVPPAWTRGHRFTVEHVIDAGQERRVFLHARDGAGVHAATSSGARPDATVRLTPETFHALLRDEPPAPGLRPHVRGDRRAVAALRGWADGVLGR